MFSLNKKFIYPALERIDGEIRRYRCNGELLPSVTTILSTLEKPKELEEWINRVGQEESTRIKDESADVGSTMHNNIENYILTGTAPSGKILEKILSNLIIKDLSNNLNECWATEAPLFYPSMYAGTTDCVGIYNNKESIIDFKNSRRDKTKEEMKSYYLQCAAYSLAHDYTYGTSINQFVILVSCWSGKLVKVIIDQDEVEFYKEQWALTLEKYYSA